MYVDIFLLVYQDMLNKMMILMTKMIQEWVMKAIILTRTIQVMYNNYQDITVHLKLDSFTCLIPSARH